MKQRTIKFLSLIAPRLFVSLAYRTLTNPQVKKLRPHELDSIDAAHKTPIKFGEFDIQTYEWGDSSNEKILLVHGWEGKEGNFAELINTLLRRKLFCCFI